MIFVLFLTYTNPISILYGPFKMSRQIEACRGQSNTASFSVYLVISYGLELNYFLWKEINERKLYMNNSNCQHLFCIFENQVVLTILCVFPHVLMCMDEIIERYFGY